jgi:hypothetical protein
MSLVLPTWGVEEVGGMKPGEEKAETEWVGAKLPEELLSLERRTSRFTRRDHWELSTSITTNHLLAIISLANTLMSLNNASFVAEQERSRKLMR